MRHKGWRKDGKTLIRCYTVALKFWDKFNASNSVFLYFSSYRSIKIWHFYLKNVGKNNKAVHLRLLFTYLHQNLSSIKKHVALVLKKFVHVLFYVYFQTILNKAVNILCALAEWVRNIQMIQCFKTIKTWMRILHD